MTTTKACDENDGQATTVNTCMIFLVRSLYFTSLYDEMHNSPTVCTVSKTKTKSKQQ